MEGELTSRPPGQSVVDLCPSGASEPTHTASDGWRYSSACDALGVEIAGLNVLEKARKCWTILFGEAKPPVATAVAGAVARTTGSRSCRAAALGAAPLPFLLTRSR